MLQVISGQVSPATGAIGDEALARLDKMLDRKRPSRHQVMLMHIKRLEQDGEAETRELAAKVRSRLG